MKFANFFDALEDSARPLVMEALGVDAACPVCRAELSARVRGAFRAGNRVKCTPCGWRGTWHDGTILKRSRLSASQFLFLSALIRFSDDNRQIAEFIGVDPDTVRAWRVILAEVARD